MIKYISTYLPWFLVLAVDILENVIFFFFMFATCECLVQELEDDLISHWDLYQTAGWVLPQVFSFFLKLQFRNSHLIQLQHYLFIYFLFLSLCLVQNGPLEWLFSFVLDRWTYNRELIMISLFLQSIISLGVCLRAYVYVNGRSNSSRSLLHHQRAGVGTELLPCLLYSPMDVKLWCLKCVNNFLHVTVSVWELNTQKEKCTERFCELCTL